MKKISMSILFLKQIQFMKLRENIYKLTNGIAKSLEFLTQTEIYLKEKLIKIHHSKMVGEHIFMQMEINMKGFFKMILFMDMVDIGKLISFHTKVHLLLSSRFLGGHEYEGDWKEG